MGSREVSNMLEIKNYAFIEIDHVKGPADPLDFYDVLYVDVAESSSDWLTNYSFLVCTPKGIEGYMKDRAFSYLFGRDHLIVLRFDLSLILEAVRSNLHNIWSSTLTSQADIPSQKGAEIAKATSYLNLRRHRHPSHFFQHADGSHFWAHKSFWRHDESLFQRVSA